jgi:hypothetical protein
MEAMTTVPHLAKYQLLLRTEQTILDINYGNVGVIVMIHRDPDAKFLSEAIRWRRSCSDATAASGTPHDKREVTGVKARLRLRPSLQLLWEWGTAMAVKPVGITTIVKSVAGSVSEMLESLDLTIM